MNDSSESLSANLLAVPQGGDKTLEGDRPDTTTIAVIGDVHDLWDSCEESILKQLGVDLVLFVGDFGNEAVELVERIAQVDLPKAAVLGNHDAWYTATPWGRTQCPYDRKKEDWVQQQLELLGTAHVGYGWLDFPAFNLTVVGSRPFSWGGSEWKYKRFYRDRFQVRNFRESTERMMKAVNSAAHSTIIFLGHCGPYGLGDRPEDICGKDWGRSLTGGDYGDPDFAEAIDQARLMGKTVPLVAFGHMHHSLRHRQDRERMKVIHDGSTLFLNAASVPRIRDQKDNQGHHPPAERIYSFSLVQLRGGQVTSAQLVWANRAGRIVKSEGLYELAFQETSV
ncbi:MAG: TIGR04168 family protein [Cyanothece sp. SIO2G6]|nr:TIGR04168 family protein [Cyanothece sp. SIO2G6]